MRTNSILPIAALVAAALAAPAHADPLKIYGRLDVSMQSSDEQDVSQTQIVSNASRFGVRGDFDLEGGSAVFYQLEWEVDVADNSNASHFKSRNQFVGLRGDWGSFRIGRFDTPFKTAQLKFDLFNDWEGDIKRVLNGEVRASNIFQYTSPSLMDDALRLNVALLPGESPVTGNDGLADAMAASIEYGSGPFALALAFESDVEGTGVDSTRLVGTYKFGDGFRLGAIYQTTDAGPGLDGSGYGLSLAYTAGLNTFKVQLMDSDTWTTGVGGTWEDSMSVGMDHRLGDRAKLYGFYTTGTDGITSLDDSYLGFGLQLNF